MVQTAANCGVAVEYWDKALARLASIAVAPDNRGTAAIAVCAWSRWWGHTDASFKPGACLSSLPIRFAAI
jgi:hypothetical protein